MFKYTRAAVDIIINDIKKYCNIFKYGTMVFTFIYFGYAIFAKSGNLIINIMLLSLFALYAVLDLFTTSKSIKPFKRFIRRSYKGVKFVTKTFSLGVMVYGIYMAASDVDGISIILATLMIITWILQLLFEIVIELFENKKDLIVAGWNKDIENLKKPVTTVNNFIKKFKGEEIVENKEDGKEIKILEKKIKENQKVNV